METDSAYLLSLDPDRFLHNFRLIAGLAPKAPLYGGWEKDGTGRCLGHYLSALSIQYRVTGDKRFQEKIDYTVDELALCQEKNGGGFLTGILTAKAMFARVAQGDLKGWGSHPWYKLHKVMAGLRDAYRLGDNTKARQVFLEMCDWAINTTKALTDDQFQIMLKEEFGGMREVLADAYAMTGERKYLDLANRFYHLAVEEPLAGLQDDLNGLHANTTIPKIIGDARIYELTGEKKQRIISEYFWGEVVRHHSYVIGGNSLDEHFGKPDEIANRLTPITAETCNTYNMLKLTRHLIEWEPKIEYADYYERALYNHILASEAGEGMFTYYVSMKPGGRKKFSTPFNDFWCCVGTGMENHVTYGDSIYFHTEESLYVNLFIPSQLEWREKGLSVKQQTDYPATNTTLFTLSCALPVKLAFKIRYPAWALPGFSLKVNGKMVPVDAKPGSYVSVVREWKQGDQIESRIPMGLRTEATPDNPKRISILYGPIVLGGQLDSPDSNGSMNTSNATDAASNIQRNTVPVPSLATKGMPVEQWVERVPGDSLAFRTKGVGRPRDVALVPFYQQVSEHYTVYWDVVTEDWRK
jgi:DUF1680 family protein